MTEQVDHVWIEITTPETLPDRLWMCNLHPGEEKRQPGWEPPPSDDRVAEIERLRDLLACKDQP